MRSRFVSAIQTGKFTGAVPKMLLTSDKQNKKGTVGKTAAAAVRHNPHDDVVYHSHPDSRDPPSKDETDEVYLIRH